MSKTKPSQPGIGPWEITDDSDNTIAFGYIDQDPDVQDAMLGHYVLLENQEFPIDGPGVFKFKRTGTWYTNIGSKQQLKEYVEANHSNTTRVKIRETYLGSWS